MSTIRDHFGFFCRPEQVIIKYYVARIPSRIKPDHLTALACVGAILSGVSLIGCWYSNWMLVPFYLGLFAHWVGDSFDGAIARYRRCERHRVGFLIDRACDMFSFCVIILCLGLSPLLPTIPSLLLLIGYLVHTVYGLMRNLVNNKQSVGFGGIGATEGRILIGLWVAGVAFLQIDFASLQIYDISLFTILSTIFFIMSLALTGRRVCADIVLINAMEAPQSVNAITHDGNVIKIGRSVSGMRGAKFETENKIARFTDKEIGVLRQMAKPSKT